MQTPSWIQLLFPEGESSCGGLQRNFVSVLTLFIVFAYTGASPRFRTFFLVLELCIQKI